MKQHFDKNRHRLTDREREDIWRAIDEACERPRRRAFPRPAWGLALAAALSAVVAVGIWQRGGPEDPRRMVAPAVEEVLIDEAPVAGEAPAAEEALADAETRAVPGTRVAAEAPERADAVPAPNAPAGEEKKHAAADPAAPEETPTVASSEMARRAPAAAATEGAPTRPAAPLAGEAAKGTMTFEVSPKLDTEAGRGCIWGRVKDADTGDPLPYANIVVEGTHYGVMSLEEGIFHLCLPPGTYTLRATYMGYAAVEVADFVVESDSTEVLYFAMNSGIAAELPTMVVEGPKPTVDVKSSEVKTHKRGGELHVRGGRSGETSMFIEGVPVSESQPSPQISGIARGGEAEEAFGRLRPGTLIERPRRRCWWPPGIHPPGGEPFADMFFQHYGVNPFLATEDDALSTFAVDVDNASYTLTRSYIERGHLPPRDAVRVEEFVNFFAPGWPRVDEGDFALRADGMPSPYGEGYHLLRVGIQGREVDGDERLPANLVFVIDTSGSMARENRLGLVKRALMVLMGELREGDTVGIVEYGSRGRIVLQPTGVEDREAIERAVLSLSPGGSTNAEEGLELGYMMAARRRDPGIINRIILCSDGVANTGETQAERILDRVRLESDRGVHLSAVGFGMGNYNDVLMEKLADQGDGNYHYVDRFEEARRVFRENLTGTLQTIARDAKVQVEFDEESVSRYRLLGYENRDVADEDFRNDAVDAGELGAGHTVTALYEVKLTQDAREAQRRGRRPARLATVRLRYELPAHHARAGEVIELEREVTTRDLAAEVRRAEPGLRLAALAAEFAEILRDSFWARGASLDGLADEARALREALAGDDAAEDLAWLVRRAAELEERDARLGDPDRYERIGDDR